MNGFELDENGDVLIQNNQIQMINGDDLLRQTVKSVIGTNKGEWFLNEDEGITFENIKGKYIDEDIIKDEIEQGLSQIDESFSITEFSYEIDSNNRKLEISFSAVNDDGTVIDGENTYE